MTEDRFTWPLMVDLVVALANELEAADLPEVDWIGAVLSDGAVPMDCGKAWVRLVNQVPMVNQDGTPNRCATTLVATIEVGVGRCVPVMVEGGEPPTVAEELEALGVAMADQQAARRAICKTLGNRAWDLVMWQPFGPAGGFGGGVWQFTVQEF